MESTTSSQLFFEGWKNCPVLTFDSLNEAATTSCKQAILAQTQLSKVPSTEIPETALMTPGIKMLGLAKDVCLFSPCRMTSIPTSNHSTFMQTQQRFQWRNEISGRFARKFFHSEPNSSRFFVNSSNFYQSAEMVS